MKKLIIILTCVIVSTFFSYSEEKSANSSDISGVGIFSFGTFDRGINQSDFLIKPMASKNDNISKTESTSSTSFNMTLGYFVIGFGSASGFFLILGIVLAAVYGSSPRVINDLLQSTSQEKIDQARDWGYAQNGLLAGTIISWSLFAACFAVAAVSLGLAFVISGTKKLAKFEIQPGYQNVSFGMKIEI